MSFVGFEGMQLSSFVVIPVSCHGGQSSFVGGWSKWAVVVTHAHFVLLFVGMRDGGSLFFVCSHAHFLSLFVGGWSEHSSSLVGFHGLWVVSFVGGQGFVLMVGSSCRSWAVVPVLCGGWSWFMGYWGGHPTSLVGCTHLVSWWAMVVGGCAPCHSWILTGGKLWLFVGGHAHFMAWWAIVVGGWLVQCG